MLLSTRCHLEYFRGKAPFHCDGEESCGEMRVDLMDDSFESKMTSYFFYYFCTPIPLVISVLTSLFLAWAALGDSLGGILSTFFNVYLLWILLLCLNFFLCGAGAGWTGLSLLPIVPAVLYMNRYASADTFLLARGYASLFLMTWYIFNRIFIFLEERRRPII
jgi:hypothetical protein